MVNMQQSIKPHQVSWIVTYLHLILLFLGSCFLHTSYLYNTKHHPIDIGALDCCSSTAFYQGKCTKNSEEQLKRFFHGKSPIFSWKMNHRNLFSIPLEQMLDIGDLIWYCNDIRRQIEKIRYYAPDNQQPLLKYLRSNSFVPSRTDSDQPATTTTASSSSSYSFSDVLSSVNDSLQSYRIFFKRRF